MCSLLIGGLQTKLIRNSRLLGSHAWVRLHILNACAAQLKLIKNIVSDIIKKNLSMNSPSSAPWLNMNCAPNELHSGNLSPAIKVFLQFWRLSVENYKIANRIWNTQLAFAKSIRTALIGTILSLSCLIPIVLTRLVNISFTISNHVLTSTCPPRKLWSAELYCSMRTSSTTSARSTSKLAEI